LVPLREHQSKQTQLTSSSWLFSHPIAVN
jgi:hypothetical protein